MEDTARLDEARIDDEYVAIQMADALDVDIDDLDIDEDSDFGIDYWRVTLGRREYIVFEDEDDARIYAENLVAEDLENIPEAFDEDWLKRYVYMSDTDRRLYAQDEAYGYVNKFLSEEDVVEEADLENEYEDAMDADDFDRADEIVAEARDIVALDKYREIYNALDDPIQYFVNEQGMYSIKDLLKQPFIQIDIDEASKDAVRADGVGHFLARYDGDEQETERGLMYYREN